MASENEWLLDVRNLHVRFFQDEGTVHAVNGVDIRVRPGEAIGIVGESGCGKTVTSYAVLNILPASGKITAGEVHYRTESGDIVDLSKLSPKGSEIRALRGGDIAMIFQEPMAAFSPVHTMFNQIAEGLLLHKGPGHEQARERVVELLQMVGIPNPEQRVDEYAFQLSGGMRQRAMIAMALASNPRILIADEPTTALDVTIQAQVLKLIGEMQRELGLALILITHDLGVIAHMVDFVYVMYLGRVVETGPVSEIFDNPKHPYTRDLIRSIPKISDVGQKLAVIEGSVPDAYRLPTGCPYHPRCMEIVGQKCMERLPALAEAEANHFARCFIHTDLEKEEELVRDSR